MRARGDLWRVVGLMCSLGGCDLPTKSTEGMKPLPKPDGGSDSGTQQAPMRLDAATEVALDAAPGSNAGPDAGGPDMLPDPAADAAMLRTCEVTFTVTGAMPSKKDNELVYVVGNDKGLGGHEWETGGVLMTETSTPGMFRGAAELAHDTLLRFKFITKKGAYITWEGWDWGFDVHRLLLVDCDASALLDAGAGDGGTLDGSDAGGTQADAGASSAPPSIRSGTEYTGEFNVRPPETLPAK